MSVRCHVSIDGDMTTASHAFVVVPRIGEIIFIPIGDRPDMFRVVNINHFAEGASKDDPSASISLNVTRKNVLNAKA
jgi:hypothetical protein